MEIIIAVIVVIALIQTILTGSIFPKGGTNDRDASPFLYWSFLLLLITIIAALFISFLFFKI